MSALKRHQEDRLFRVYVTDALQAVAENTTHMMGLGGVTSYGRTMRLRWAELVEPGPRAEEPPEDDRPCEEIAADIWARIKGGE